MNQAELIHLLSGIGEAVLITEDDGTVCFVNEIAQQWLGYDPEAVVGQPCWQVVEGMGERGTHVCKIDCEIMQSCRRTHKIPAFDLFVLKADDTRQWLNTSTLVVPSDQEGHFYIVHVWRDVEQRKEIELLMEDIVMKIAHFRHSESVLSSPPFGKRNVQAAVLTEQETNVLRLLSKGCKTTRIAEELHISTVTVRNHVQHLMKRLQVHSRLEAIQVATRLGIL